MVNISDTIAGTLPFYLKAEVVQTGPQSWLETWQTRFGRYDFLPTDSNRVFFDFEKGAALSEQFTQFYPAGNIGAPLPYSLWIQTTFFFLFLFSFIIFAFFFQWEGTALKGNFKGAFSFGKRVVPSHKSQVTKTEAWGEFYLLFQTILVFSILLFSWLWSNGFSIFTTTVQMAGFGAIFAAITLLVYLKIGGYRFIGTFFLKTEMKGWSIYYTRMMEILGIVLFLPAICYVYLHEFRNIILIVVVIVFFISRLVICIELLNIFVKNKISPFYFFVYLCGIEIAPYLLLYKGVLFAITNAGDIII